MSSSSSSSSLVAESERFERLLYDQVLPFWLKHGWDRKHGGIMTILNFDGAAIDTTKSGWFQGRAGWMFATAAYELLSSGADVKAERAKGEEFMAFARSCCDFIERHCRDQSQGGKLYFSVTREGKGIRNRRYVYSESFASIAHAACARAVPLSSSDKTAAAQVQKMHADLAVSHLEFFLRFSFVPGVMAPKYQHPQMMGIAPFMIALVTAQELRLCLDSSSSASSAVRVKVDPTSLLHASSGEKKKEGGLSSASLTSMSLNEVIDACIHRILNTFVKDDLRVCLEVVDSATGAPIWDHAEGRTLNPGHAIECSWFLMHEGRVRGNRRYIDRGMDILDYASERGLCPVVAKNGRDESALLMFVDLDRSKQSMILEHSSYYWWTHNELMIAALMAAVETAASDPARSRRYFQLYQRTARFAFRQFSVKNRICKTDTSGEWVGYLSNAQEPISTSVGSLFKGPFHFPRQLLVCSQLLKELASKMTTTTTSLTRSSKL